MAYHKKKDIHLKRGDRGPEVKEIQVDLNRLGYQVGRPDGAFGPATERAVISFQEEAIPPGVVNYQTAFLIHSLTVEKIEMAMLPDISFIPSPNFSSRRGRGIDMLVIHFTASGSLENSVHWFENPTANASAHYVLGKDGRVTQMVKDEDKAWHAGKSQWGGVPHCNNNSIGIEIVNWGILKQKDGVFYCWPGNYTKKYSGTQPGEAAGNFWEPYADEQYTTLIALTKKIIRNHAIPPERIVGHSDIAPGRKADPGPLFDWKRYKSALI